MILSEADGSRSSCQQLLANSIRVIHTPLDRIISELDEVIASDWREGGEFL